MSQQSRKIGSKKMNSGIEKENISRCPIDMKNIRRP
jgi:hypothetical protein